MTFKKASLSLEDRIGHVVILKIRLKIEQTIVPLGDITGHVGYHWNK